MQTLLREYELYIGQLKELKDLTKCSSVSSSPATKNTPSVDVRSAPELKGFVRLTNHHFDASVVFDRDGSGSKNPTQTFNIYNPTDETLEYLKYGNIVLLKAGYNQDDSLPVICATEIIKTEIIKPNADRIIKLTCSEAYNARSKIKYNKSFPRGTSYIDVVLDMLDTFANFGVPTGLFAATNLNGITLNKAMVFSDSIYGALETVCNATSYKWYIATGEVYIVPKYSEATDSQYVSVVEVTEDNVKEAVLPMSNTAKLNCEDSEKSMNGVKVKINLNGDAGSAQGVVVNFGEYKGKYLITKVTHKLSFEGTEWDTTIECKG